MLALIAVPVAVWLGVELAEARTDARRRHQRLIERRTPRTVLCRPNPKSQVG